MKLTLLLTLFAVASSFAPVPLGVSRVGGTKLFDGKANAIRDRIVTVKNTKKITMAMKLVAAAKVRKAQDAVLQTRPFSETLQSVFGGLISRLGSEAADLPLLQEREVKKVTLVVISGDRGLCGSYNSYMIKKAEKRYSELTAKGIEVDMVMIGKKANSYFERRDYPIIDYYDCGQKPTAKEATAISDMLLAKYLSGETDSIELLYTRFVSLIASTPSARTLLPLTATGIESEGDEIFQLTTSAGDFSVEKTKIDAAEPASFPADMIFEQDPVSIVEAILPLYLNGQILRTMQESVASELAARMQSMQSASDNAGELAKNLSLQYNRARQAAVTQEILEIVSGASALEG
mmetsp:Transcript_26152/g.54490  ORF Transcript_26152/g.54490 Transcript_26152/m.54490 type:complete len:349 (+) Transcript_26152:45-1091(+)